ncbi:ABC transporter permease [Pseudomonas saudimassiliensis]|uniref:ABC transporter permease n=1 Tax=Pseudomonas saudimassiliensis TaxID=1461581 RepID=A0A078M9T9_9PSED|nr:ABC transporter permease [Pseudomonas saudimassiliensis]CEA03009.1 ABC transporter permease [Pseudomonas saudimassiliensis]CEF26042.1 ABC transporter permease [Pseudomonas saudimassiliensis]
MPDAENRFVVRSGDNPDLLVIQGDWILEHYTELRQLVGQLRKEGETREPDLSQLGRLDTAGGQLLTELLGSERIQSLTDEGGGLPEERRILLRRIADSLQGKNERPPSHGALFELLGNIGKGTLSFYSHVVHLLGFIGLTLAGLVSSLVRPGTWRVTSVVAQIEQIALNAVGIVALLTFMVGAVIAFLGATVLADFGATIYTVDLIAFSFLREFAVLLTAILMAGRTASAFTAQIGSMKANEEIDAIRTLGLNPLQILVIPRVIAMMISLPILTFIGMLSGLLGGAVVCSLALDISPTMFLSILQQNVAVQHFYLGMAKAPLFAFLIAIIGCMEGFKVSGSAESVGEHTTSSVVQSIFVVILMDALAALFFMEMDW